MIFDNSLRACQSLSRILSILQDMVDLDHVSNEAKLKNLIEFDVACGKTYRNKVSLKSCLSNDYIHNPTSSVSQKTASCIHLKGSKNRMCLCWRNLPNDTGATTCLRVWTQNMFLGGQKRVRLALLFKKHNSKFNSEITFGNSMSQLHSSLLRFELGQQELK